MASTSVTGQCWPGSPAGARSLGLPAVVMSFEPTPREYFMGAAAPPRLASFREKFVGLVAQGVDRLFCARFDAAMAQLSPEISSASTWSMGSARATWRSATTSASAGIAPVISAPSRQPGSSTAFEVADTPTCVLDGVRVSSTAVRAALAAGDLGSRRACWDGIMG
jgi:riboflavin kinase / FMN adenylyltransferase